MKTGEWCAWLTAALDALGPRSEDGGCQRAKIGVEVLHREVNLAHSSVQHCSAVSSADQGADVIQQLHCGAADHVPS